MPAETEPGTITVSNMLAQGVDVVDATCRYCGHAWSAPIDFLPEQTTLEKIEQLLVCPTCGRDEIDVEPDWPVPCSKH